MCIKCTLCYLEAYRHHSPTDLLPNHELLSKHGQDQVLPAPRRQAFSETDDPLTTHLIGIILKPYFQSFKVGFSFILKANRSKTISTNLPHWLNTLLEEVEVTMACKVTRPYHVAIKSPELFHLRKRGIVTFTAVIE